MSNLFDRATQPFVFQEVTKKLVAVLNFEDLLAPKNRLVFIFTIINFIQSCCLIF